jgi:hypothetical protein
MTILFAGGEIGALIPSDSAAFESASDGTFNSAFARCSTLINSQLSYADTPDVGSQTDIWFHGEIRHTNVFSPGRYLAFLNSSGTEVFRLTLSGGLTSTTIKMQYLLAGVWTDIGSSITINSSTRQEYDIHVDVTNGTADLYLAGNKRIAGSATLTGITDIAQARLGGCNQAYWSQIIVADESTIGWRLTTVPATSAGATTDWTGTYAEIDEITYSDADFINSATANQVELFAHGTVVPSGYKVRGVAVTARAKKGSTGPANLQLALRSGGTVYVSSSNALDEGYGAFCNIWETDPATSADFTTSAITALQFGVKSIT